MKQRKSLRNMLYISLGAVIIAIGAWISVPFAVPFTMQTFSVFLLLNVFGGKTASLSVLLYIALGVVGIPVFSGFNSGISVLVGPNGGFVIGFVTAGCLYFALERIFAQKTHQRLFLSLISLAACYTCGTAWYMFYLTSVNQTIGIFSAISVCVLPYVIPDVIKIIFAHAVSKRIKKAIKS